MRLLALVLSHVEVERPAVDLDDEPAFAPDEVGLLAATCG
jgi:hypothetical protein